MKAFVSSLLIVAALGGGCTAFARDLTAEEAAPFLGLYWDNGLQRPHIVVLYNGRLAIDLPWRALRELEQTTEERLWSYVIDPEFQVKFHRDGAGPATAMELRLNRTVTLPRFEPEKGLPSLDELFARRPDPQRARKLGELGTIRMSGAIERTTSQEKESFEFLSAGDKHSRTNPLAGWVLATGDWRDEFKQVRVLKRVELAGKHVFLVHAAPEKGRQRLIYLDAENGLSVGYDEVYAIPGVGMIGCEVRFADYREIDGVQIPFKSTVKHSEPELGTWTYQVEKIETRLKLDQDPFAI